MVQQTGRKNSVFRSIDWWTVIIYVALLVSGWFSVCGASYDYGDADLFSLSARSGMQIVWIGTSLVLATVLLLLDDRLYDTFAYVIFGLLLLLLFATIFNPHSIKGSRSWLVLGPLRLQPAEFAKFATALALAKFMSSYGYDIRKWKDFLKTLAIVLTPMLFIVMQRETGSALVYLAFFLMFYREGMTGSILFTGVAMVLYFVIGIRFAEPTLWHTPTSVGYFIVFLLIQLFSSGMIGTYCNRWDKALMCMGICLGVTLACLLFSFYVVPFNLFWVQLSLCILLIGYLVWQALRTRVPNYFWIFAFSAGSLIFFNSADYALNHVLEEHRSSRIDHRDLRGGGDHGHADVDVT